MKRKIIGKSVYVLVGAILFIYLALLLTRMGNEVSLDIQELNTGRHGTIGIFGATGTVGDGLLKAAMIDPDVDKIHVVTRRASPRIDEGVVDGKIVMTIHKDYLEYSRIRNVLAEVDAVYWAIGLSAVGLDEQKYREIHVTYPLRLVEE